MPCAEVVLSDRAAEIILDGGLMPLLSLRDQDVVRLARFQSIADPLAPLAGQNSRMKANTGQPKRYPSDLTDSQWKRLKSSCSLRRSPAAAPARWICGRSSTASSTSSGAAVPGG